MHILYKNHTHARTALTMQLRSIYLIFISSPSPLIKQKEYWRSDQCHNHAWIHSFPQVKYYIIFAAKFVHNNWKWCLIIRLTQTKSTALYTKSKRHTNLKIKLFFATNASRIPAILCTRSWLILRLSKHTHWTLSDLNPSQFENEK